MNFNASIRLVFGPWLLCSILNIFVLSYGRILWD
jgi:hypothetical protein